MLTRSQITRSKTLTGPAKPRMRKCAAKGCQNKFAPRSMTHKACSPDCSINIGNLVKEKKSRKEDAIKREKLKTRSDWMKDAQTAFNRYIRERDKDKPCICCGKPLGESAIGGGFDCGHYRSVGSAPHLRFTESNAAAQRKQCNRYGAGRAVDYRIGLISRIGLQSVEQLETDNTPRKYTIEDLKAIKAEFVAKYKEIKGKNNAITP